MAGRRRGTAGASAINLVNQLLLHNMQAQERQQEKAWEYEQKLRSEIFLEDYKRGRIILDPVKGTLIPNPNPPQMPEGLTPESYDPTTGVTKYGRPALDPAKAEQENQASRELARFKSQLDMNQAERQSQLQREQDLFKHQLESSGAGLDIPPEPPASGGFLSDLIQRFRGASAPAAPPVRPAAAPKAVPSTTPLPEQPVRTATDTATGRKVGQFADGSLRYLDTGEPYQE